MLQVKKYPVFIDPEFVCWVHKSEILNPLSQYDPPHVLFFQYPR